MTIADDLTGRVSARLTPNGARLDLLIAGAVTVFAGVIRFVRLGTPHEIIPLDETYYAKDAAAYLAHGSEDGFAVHPPVGKWLIAAGMKVFGNNAVGWRVSAALFGTLSVLVLYLLARRLWGSPWIAGGVSLLLAADGLSIVQSRIAMLDIFLAFFVLLSVWMLAEDRARTPVTHVGPRWWRLGSGAAVGLAVATKWAALFVIPVVAAVALAWEFARTRDPARDADEPPPGQQPWITPAPPPGPPPPFAGAAWRRVGRVAGTFVLLPVVLYVASYAPWFADDDRYTAPRCTHPDFGGVFSVLDKLPDEPKAWTCYQREIFDYHKGLKNFDDKGKPIHPYLTRAWTWPWVGRPTAHYFDSTGEESNRRSAHILGLPNPALWFPAFFLGIPLCAWWAFRRSDTTAGLLLVMLAPLYLPWLVTARPLFMFYMTPAVPVLALMVGHVIHRMMTGMGDRAVTATATALLALPFTPLFVQWLAAGPSRGLLWEIPATGAILAGARYLVGVFRGQAPRLALAHAGIALAMVAYFYPVLTAAHIPDRGTFGWRNHMWMQVDCRSPVETIEVVCWI